MHISKVFLLLLLPTLNYGQTHSPEISHGRLEGRVTDGGRTPLYGAFVGTNLTGLGRNVRTDSNGRFVLPSTGTIVSFRKHGFRPISFITASLQRPLSVVMEAASATEWRIPRWSGTDGHAVGSEFWQFNVPSTITIRRNGGNWEVWRLEARLVDTKGEAAILTFTFGSAIAGEDETRRQADLSEVTERSVSVKGQLGIEGRGKLRNGTLWREVSLWNGNAEYSGVSAEAASVFDRVIDSACYPAE